LVNIGKLIRDNGHLNEILSLEQALKINEALLKLAFEISMLKQHSFVKYAYIFGW
jgi:hypothetical protein